MVSIVDMNVQELEKLPTVVLVIGMAGAGKSALMQRLVATLGERKQQCYVVNLDAAALHVNYPVNIDIRDTVNYKQVMEEYKLGPNGGIVTSLNLFATRFDQVISILEKRVPEVEFVLIDTPGQLEVFNWSASGQIITESLASSFPTVVLYVADTPRCASPITYQSNMLYSCSIMYKTKLPLLIAFNKTDILSHEFAVEWTEDFDKLELALRSENSYMATLTRSMSLMLEQFYKAIQSVGVSAVTGEGAQDLFVKLAKSREEYFEIYLPYLQNCAVLKRSKSNSLDRQENDSGIEREIN